MSLRFEKYHALGNDYLIYDCNKNSAELKTEQIPLICNRNYGIGSDGILIGPILKDSIGVRIINPDGSEAEKSGNGIRIFSKYLKDAGYVKEDHFCLTTLGGEVEVTYRNKRGTIIEVFMGKASFQSKDIGADCMNGEMLQVPLRFGDKEYKCTCVSVGNPHCVIPMEEISKELVCNIGRYSETASCFPNRINTQIVKVLDRNNIQIEIFERGAGYTLASGSSSCAAAAAMQRLGFTDKEVAVHMPGGILKINLTDDNSIYMTGGVSRVGSISLSEEFIEENQIFG